jgi:DNA topoisomerase-1
MPNSLFVVSTDESMPNLLLIESPKKIQKLQQILGNSWIIKASFGHIRELASDGEEALGFELTGQTVNCRFVPRSPKAAGIIKELKQIVTQVEKIYIATDPDREGETIGWHLAQVLRLKNPQRVTYTEITESAIKQALANPRPLALNRVNAGLARTCLDKLVGYRGSPLVWSLKCQAKSIGRVQSAALHILCNREREILAFKPTDYWSVEIDYAQNFRAFYLGERNFPNVVDEDPALDDTSESREKILESSRVFSQEKAEQLIQIAKNFPHRVRNIEGKVIERQPPAPFTTSTLQQAASSRLKFSPKQTMTIAQTLYEKGLITYMRTDSVTLSEEFCARVKQWLETKDPTNIPELAAKHRNRKNAQEAHEAIRPTDIDRPSSALKQELLEDEFQLYLTIWLRSVASQCKNARIRQTRIITQSETVFWLTNGSIVEFPGYSKYWKNLAGDKLLPQLCQGQSLFLREAKHQKKQTQPLSRYTEAKLIQVMEKKGIGRPSTYAPTVSTLKEREYASLNKGKLQPTESGLTVDEFLQNTLPELLEADFTAQMESTLDAIENGKEDWQHYLTNWNREYFAPAIDKAWASLGGKPTANSTTKTEQKLTSYPCPVCGTPLAEYTYVKDGQTKKMLRCSSAKVKERKHKDAVFFESRGAWWSKKYGNLSLFERLISRKK